MSTSFFAYIGLNVDVIEDRWENLNMCETSALYE
jgi:DNA primase large subunit